MLVKGTPGVDRITLREYCCPTLKNTPITANVLTLNIVNATLESIVIH